MSPSTVVCTLRMSSWCLGQRLFWVLQEVSGHCIYGHETGNRSRGCIVWASWRLTTCALSSLCQESPSPRPIFGQRVLGQIRRTTNHEKQAIGFSLLYDHPVCVSCIYINYHFDAVLVLHTRTASLVDAMEVQTQCRGAPTEIWYWSRGVCWRGN